MAPAENDASFRKQIASIRAALLPENFALFRKKPPQRPCRANAKALAKRPITVKARPAFRRTFECTSAPEWNAPYAALVERTIFRMLPLDNIVRLPQKPGKMCCQTALYRSPPDRVIGGGAAPSPRRAPFSEKIASFCKKTGCRY